MVFSSLGRRIVVAARPATCDPGIFKRALARTLCVRTCHPLWRYSPPAFSAKLFSRQCALHFPSRRSYSQQSTQCVGALPAASQPAASLAALESGVQPFDYTALVACVHEIKRLWIPAKVDQVGSPALMLLQHPHLCFDSRHGLT